MVGGIEEIEQGFIPLPEFIEKVRACGHAYQIVQCYLPDNLIKSLNKAASSLDIFEGGREIISLPLEDKRLFAALVEADVKTGGKMLQNARIRYRKDLSSGQVEIFYTIKGAKSNGVAAEFEFKIADIEAAKKLMREYGAERVVAKIRYVVPGFMIAGRERVLELDEFQGAHAGKYKLEIEYESVQHIIDANEWRKFAALEVTDDKNWSNSRMAGRDLEALKLLGA